MKVAQSFTPRITKKERTQMKRQAEKVLRVLGGEFPVVSSSKVVEMPSLNKHWKFKILLFSISEKLKSLRSEVFKPLVKSKDLEYYEGCVNLVKEYKVANCGEMATLCKLLSNLNGIEVQPIGMFLQAKRCKKKIDIDHAIYAISLDGKQINGKRNLSKQTNTLVIDPWLGFAEFGPKAEERFRYDYQQFFDIRDDLDLKIEAIDDGEPVITDFMKTYFFEKFPQFKVK